MAALQYVDIPGYAALLLRRSYSDLTLPGSLMERAEQWLRGTDAHWAEKEKTWEFPSGAKITFGYLANETDKYRYKSAEFQFIGFDELTQFTGTMYLFLMSRLRRLVTSKIPLRMRSASNPGDIGHEWVRSRFVDHKPEVLPTTPAEEIFRTVRPFIPAKLADNPHLDAVEYAAALEELDPVTKAQMLNGDWSARRVGAKFKREDFCRYIDLEEVPTGLRFFRWWDLASTEPKPNSKNKDPDWTCGALVGYHEKSGDWICKDVKYTREDPAKTEDFIYKTAVEDGIAVRIYMEQEPGASGKTVIDNYRRKVLVGFDFRGQRSTGSKEVRAIIFAASVGNHKFVLVRAPWNRMLITNAEGFPMPGYHDDDIDAISGCMQKHRGKKRARVVGRSVKEMEREEMNKEIQRSQRMVMA